MNFEAARLPQLAQLALWAAEHALPAFFLLLALAWGASWAGWCVWRRAQVRRHTRAVSHRPSIAWRVAVGLVISLGSAAVFAALALQLGAGTGLSQVDQALTDALRASVAPWTQQLFAVLTHLGDPATLTLLGLGIALVLVMHGQRAMALGWVLALAGNGLLNPTLKQVFGRARPLQAQQFVQATGLSFPSGHSSGAVVAYGMLAYLALKLLAPRWQLPALLAAASLVVTVGASRVFLRVHFSSDVLAGFASGAAWLALCITALELVLWWRAGRS
ncbi:phosphatase PAP2 family protein [Rhodoferax sp.]|uniref:phosphatase PAP2 family protein n=1 Tax=Rhodoferax sp. TaxID=50421 RepID=UPI0025D6D11F|nr:phosphatase PAP2 family protein [Rhodoferax sp.]